MIQNPYLLRSRSISQSRPNISESTFQQKELQFLFQNCPCMAKKSHLMRKNPKRPAKRRLKESQQLLFKLLNIDESSIWRSKRFPQEEQILLQLLLKIWCKASILAKSKLSHHSVKESYLDFMPRHLSEDVKTVFKSSTARPTNQ